MVTTSTVTAGADRAHILKDAGVTALTVNRYYKVPRHIADIYTICGYSIDRM
jgi:hypothetical protein